MKKIGKIMAVLCATIMGASMAACSKSKGGDTTGKYLSYNAPDAVTFDYSARDGSKTQYIKKFDQFATTWGFVGDQPGYIRRASVNQIPAVADLNAESMRFDLFMGYTGLGYGIANASDKNGTTDEEYAQAMQVINKLLDCGVAPQLVLFACPAYAQSYGSWKSKPKAQEWRELCRNMAEYFKNKGIRIGAYEIWNEPDLGDAYFDGDWQDYIDTYIAGAKGVKEGDPDAFVEGMSASWIHKIAAEKTNPTDTLTKWESFIKQANDEGVLPDSISWHFYGRDGRLEDIVGLSGDGENFSVYRNAILSALNSSQSGASANDSTAYDLSTLQQNLNEFNVYAPLHEDSRDMWNTTSVVPGMFSAMETLLAANDVTRVNWATFLSEQTNGIGCSSVDLYSLRRYPAYYANWMYGRLPVGRIAQPSLGDGLSTMAGVDDGRAGLIVYNSSSSSKTFCAKLDNLPFDKGDVTVYTVDSEHLTYSTVNEPCALETGKDVSVGGLCVSLELEPNAVCYVEINGDKPVETAYSALHENLVRKDYWYPERGDNTPYADVHERSMLAYLGMNGNESGKTAVCATLDGMKGKTLTVDRKAYNLGDASVDAALGMKIDFRTIGGYAKSVYYTVEGYDADITVPFGKSGECDEKKLFDAVAGKDEVALDDIAPADWDGRIVVSYIIANAGKNAVASFKLL